MNTTDIEFVRESDVRSDYLVDTPNPNDLNLKSIRNILTVHGHHRNGKMKCRKKY